MNIRDRKAAIRHLVPAARMDTFGDEITWLDDRPMPSDAEINTAHAALILSEASTAAHVYIEAGYNNELKDIKSRYPQLEREGWHNLVKNAENGEGKCIENYAAELNITVEEACQRILKAKENYEIIYGKATGKLTRKRDQIDQAYKNENIEELENIKWEDE